MGTKMRQFTILKPSLLACLLMFAGLNAVADTHVSLPQGVTGAFTVAGMPVDSVKVGETLTYTITNNSQEVLSDFYVDSAHLPSQFKLIANGGEHPCSINPANKISLMTVPNSDLEHPHLPTNYCTLTGEFTESVPAQAQGLTFNLPLHFAEPGSMNVNPPMVQADLPAHLKAISDTSDSLPAGVTGAFSVDGKAVATVKENQTVVYTITNGSGTELENVYVDRASLPTNFVLDEYAGWRHCSVYLEGKTPLVTTPADAASPHLPTNYCTLTGYFTSAGEVAWNINMHFSIGSTSYEPEFTAKMTGKLEVGNPHQAIPVYVFGDSWSDMGNNGIATNKPNGKTWAYYVAQDYDNLNGIQASKNGGTDYAQGGALAAAAITQVDSYLNSHNNRADPKALYIFFIGGNDIRNASTVQKQTMETAAGKVSEAAKHLLESGAQHVAVVNIPIYKDVKNIPEALRPFIPQIVITNGDNSETFNTKLSNEVTALQGTYKDRIDLVDLYKPMIGLMLPDSMGGNQAIKDHYKFDAVFDLIPAIKTYSCADANRLLKSACEETNWFFYDTDDNGIPLHPADYIIQVGPEKGTHAGGHIFFAKEFMKAYKYVPGDETPPPVDDSVSFSGKLLDDKGQALTRVEVGHAVVYKVTNTSPAQGVSLYLSGALPAHFVLNTAGTHCALNEHPATDLAPNQSCELVGTFSKPILLGQTVKMDFKVNYKRAHTDASWTAYNMASFTVGVYQPLYVFGDSLSDMGNEVDPQFKAKLGALPFPARGPYTSVDGKKYGGETWVVDVAKQLGNTTITASRPINNGAHGTDYAVSGSTTSGLDAQLTALKQDHPQLDGDALYVVWSAGNDFLYQALSNKGSTDYSPAAKTAANNMINFIKKLQATNIKHIVVINLPPIGYTPLIANNVFDLVGSGKKDPMNKAVDTYNTQLANFVHADTSGKLKLVDMYTPAEALYESNGASYTKIKFTDVKTSCWNVIGFFSCGPKKQPGFFYWDTIHPSNSGHLFLADQFMESYNAQ